MSATVHSIDTDAWIDRARRVPIEVEIKSRGINLKGNGSERVGPCPKCGGVDRFAINVKKQVFNCRGCDIGGDVIRLVQHLDGSDFLTACTRLANEPPPQRSNGQDQSAEPRKVLTATYQYDDESGALAFVVDRFELQNPDGSFAVTEEGKRRKKFSQRRPDPRGRDSWIWNIEGVPIVPYRLPELIEAVSTNQTILIAEGEVKADLLWSWNIPATCNACGAEKWCAEHSEYLRGADVVILPDNDVKGRKHVDVVGASLQGIAASIRVLNLPDLPPKGDIINWANAGGTAERLNDLIVHEAEPWMRQQEETRSNGAEPKARDEPTTNFASYASFAWPVIDEAAYYGIPGDIVRAVLPHTEADPVALLLQTLAMGGNVIGRHPYYQVESDHHRANLFTVLVGDSAKGRKGTSLGRIRSIVKVADETWSGDRIKGGLSSGEGFINEVRDPVQKYNAKEKSFEIVDPGVADKRLMIVEPEFAGAISVAERHGNTLSPLIRRAWDGDKLATLTRNSPLSATGAHISIVGHITIDELRARISRTEMGNGFANRFLFALIRRSKELPFGGDLTDSQILHLGEQLKSAIDGAKSVDRMEMTDAARSKWAAVYPELSAAKPGLLGAVIARAEAQTVRVALIYALLDGADKIDLPHLEAALAVWEYCELSAVHIFGGAIGDPVADEILRALQNTADGMTRTAINDLFGRHQSSNRIAAALQLLATKGRARPEMRQTSGRPSEIWFATGR
jgi:hypothetical protein